MSKLLRLVPCALVGTLLAWSVPARAQFVYRLGGPVMPLYSYGCMHLKNRHQFKNVIVQPYGAWPYGGAAMYSGFNHPPVPFTGSIPVEPSAPPQILHEPRKLK